MPFKQCRLFPPQSMPGGAADPDSPALLRAATIMRAATMARAATTLARSSSLTRRPRLTSKSPPPPADADDAAPTSHPVSDPGLGARADGASAARPDRGSGGDPRPGVSEPSRGFAAAVAAPQPQPSGVSVPAEPAHDPGMAHVLFSDGPGRSIFVAEEHMPGRAADTSPSPREAGKGFGRAATRAAEAAAAVEAQASGETMGGFSGSRGVLLPTHYRLRNEVMLAWSR